MGKISGKELIELEKKELNDAVSLTRTAIKITNGIVNVFGRSSAITCNILVKLHENRDIQGILTLEYDNGMRSGPYAVLGRGEPQYHSDTSKENCDTPYGLYSMRWIDPRPEKGYGPYKRILLDPIGGDALFAKNKGRKDLMIHGGPPSNKTYLVNWGSPLNITYGCLRVSDSDMLTIYTNIHESKSMLGNLCVGRF